jgi:hypothetical protein
VAAVIGRRDSLPVEYFEKGVEQIPGIGWALGPLAKRVGESIDREWKRNRSVAMKAAERAAGMSREDLEERIAAEPSVIPLTVRVLWAAGMNGNDATLKGMGRTLGHAVREPELIGEAELIVAAMTDFGPSHRAVLEALQAVPGGEAWLHDKIVERVAAPRSVVRMAVSALVARGLIDIHAGYGGGVPYSISELGRTVLDVLREVERGDKPPSSDNAAGPGLCRGERRTG